MDAKIDDNFSIQISYRYVYDTKYFKTMEDKESWEKDSYSFKGEKSEKLVGEFSIEGKRYSTSWISIPQNTPGIEVWLV